MLQDSPFLEVFGRSTTGFAFSPKIESTKCTYWVPPNRRVVSSWPRSSCYFLLVWACPATLVEMHPQGRTIVRPWQPENPLGQTHWFLISPFNQTRSGIVRPIRLSSSSSQSAMSKHHGGFVGCVVQRIPARTTDAISCQHFNQLELYPVTQYTQLPVVDPRRTWAEATARDPLRDRSTRYEIESKSTGSRSPLQLP